jgi:DNA-binding CsgD family transcriptional regulator/tetratricopeptide (TPR) repeat protein
MAVTGPELDAPIVGREREVRHVGALVDGVRGGSGGRLLFVAGEPGIGKSRLAREARGLAVASGFSPIVGRCFEQYATVPFFPLSEALGSAFAAEPARVRTRLLARRPELAALLPDALPGHASIHGEALQLRVPRAAEALLRTLAERQPLLLILEDLHWADTATLGLVLYLGRHLEGWPLMVLGTYRDVEVSADHPLEATLRELRRERGMEEVTLRGFAPEGTAALIGAWAGGEPPADALLGLLHERTGGNPFFIGEILKAMSEQALTDQASSPARWDVQPRELQVPPSIRSVVRQRVARLPRDTQSMLEMGSLLGHEFDLQALVGLSAEPADDVVEALDAAIAARVLDHARPTPPQRFAFTHVLIQQTLSDAIPAHRRRLLHLRAAETLERLHRERPHAAADLARHFLAAGDQQRAKRYALAAATHAASLYAHAEAIAHYRAVLSVAEDSGDAVEEANLQSLIAHELNELDRPGEALAAYEKALEAYELLGDVLGQARVHRELAWLHQTRMDLAAALPHLQIALQLWPSEVDDPELGWLLLDTARARAFATEFAVAEHLIERGLQLAERLGDSRLEARALLESALVRAQTGALPSTIDPLFDRAERLARAASEWRVVLRLHLNRGVNRFVSGDLEGYRTEARQALAIGEKFVQARGPASFLAEACLFLGEWDEGRRAARIACARGQILTPAHRGVLVWMEGDHAGAVRLYRDAIADARPMGAMQFVVEYLGILADSALQMGLVHDASEAAREGLDIIRRHNYWGELQWVSGPLVEAVAWSDADDAEAVMNETAALLDKYRCERMRPQHLRAQGIYFQRRGWLDAAIEALGASVDLARAQHALPEAGRTLTALEAVARSQGNHAVADQAAADRTAIVRRIGPEVRGLAWADGRLPASLADAASARGRARRIGDASTLTRREQEVAALVARGLTNRQIAETLVIAEGTAGVHVDHILSKLRFHTRAQVAHWAAQHDEPRKK